MHKIYKSIESESIKFGPGDHLFKCMDTNSNAWIPTQGYKDHKESGKPDATRGLIKLH